MSLRLSLVTLLAFASSTFAAEPDGKALYAGKCAFCHGKAGEGTKKYPQVLVGDRSVKQLAKYVGETMPEDDPGSLTAAESEAVSAYLHDAFYSPVARDRLRPARVELSRLTVRQYRNAVADLLGGNRPAPVIDDKRGLKGEYFKGRNLGRGNRALERTDATVAFDWDKGTPDAEKITEPHEFAAQWVGSVIAEETGTYDISVTSNHSVKLWFNDPDKPLLDGWVRSGNVTEYTASVPLLAGRAYPVKLQFSKAKQGVDDKKAATRPVLPAFVSLNWKPPHGTLEAIPTRCLSPNDGGPTFVATTPFPPDDRSLGWERGTAVSKEWDSATTDAALEVLSFHVERLNTLAKTTDTASDRAAKLKAYCHTFAERAFRRPLSSEEKTRYVDRNFDGAKEPDLAFKRSLLFVLKSPLFLYREPPTASDGYAVAARLAFALWDTLPDAELLKAADGDQLKTREQVLKQATRMVADPRATAKMRQFFHHWLNVEHVHDLAKDAKKFPGFDAAVIADLRTSLDLFVADAALGKTSDFRRLFAAGGIPVNDRLAAFYGVTLPVGTGFRNVPLDADKRGGVLTHPYLLAANAYTAETSPIHRGVFLTRGVMGMFLKPPPDAVAPVPPDLHPNLTTRERVTMQTKPANCQTCHTVINDLGFTLEHFDAVGKYRDTDNGKPVNASGGLFDRSGKAVKLVGAAELAMFVAVNPDVHRAFAGQVFHHAAQQPIRAYGPKALDELTEKFTKGHFDVLLLFAEAATLTATGPPGR